MTPARIDMVLRLRQAGISDNNVLRAMELLHRAAFMDASHRHMAYEERKIPIACGQTLPAPLTVAAMAQGLDLKGEEKLLEIGTGSGYQAAVLSHLCRRVYSVERYHALSESAKDALSAQDCRNVVTKHGDGRYGWRGQAPFDAIAVTAGLRVKPVSLLSQLKNGGRLVCVMNGVLTVITKTFGDIETRTLFDVDILPIEPGKSHVM